METINDRIRTSRDKKGWNQSDLARAIGVTPQTVQQWENGKTSPRNKKIDALAQALGVSADWLLTGRDMTPSLPDATNDEEGLSPREKIIIELIRDLTSDQQTDVVRSLEAQKQQNDKIWEQLSRVRGKRA